VGRFSDKFGRRAVLLPSLALFALGNLGSAASGDFVWLVLTQGVAGLGLTGMQVSLPAYLGDLFAYSVRGRAIGAATVCAASGTMLGVPAGAFLAQALGVRAAFLALGLLVAALVPLAIIFLVNTASRAEPAHAAPGVAARWHAPLRRGPVRAALFVTLCWLVMSAAIYNFLAAWLQGNLRLSTAQVGLTFAMMGGASIVANLLIATFSDRLGKRRTMLIGLALGTLSLVPLGFAALPWQGLAAICLFVLTNEFGFGAHGVLVTELAPAQRGMVVSLYMLAWGLGVTVAPPLAGLLWRAGGFQAVVLSMTGVGLLAWLVGYFFVVSPAASTLQPAASGSA
jgi:predicted MFS family arabinose efflux permease